MFAPVFVSDAPVFDLMGLRIAVGDPLLGKGTHVLQIAVLHPVAHLFGGSRTCIGADVGGTIQFAAELDKFVGSKLVGFFHSPSLVIGGDSLLAYAKMPIVSRYVAAARPTDDRGLDAAQSIQHVGAEAVLIGKFGGGIVNASVDLTMKML